MTRIAKPLAGGSPAQPPAGAPPAAQVAALPGGHVKSAVTSAQVSPATFRPDAVKQATPTEPATVGLNPHPPAVSSQSYPEAADIPMTQGGPQGFAPFSQVY